MIIEFKLTQRLANGHAEVTRWERVEAISYVRALDCIKANFAGYSIAKIALIREDQRIDVPVVRIPTE